MGNRRFLTIVLVLAIASLAILACDTSSIPTQLGIGTASKPTITVQSPSSGSTFREGDDITVQSTARDPGGIVRVELAVDGAPVRTDAPPVTQGQVVFTLVQTWKATTGTHTLSVRAFNARGVVSDPALISVTVSQSAALGPGSTPTRAPTITATPLGQSTALAITPLPGVTNTLPLTLTPTLRATTRPSPTRTRTPTVVPGPPGVYASSIRVDPTDLRRRATATFYVTFINTAGAPQDYRWRINVYRPDQLSKPMGDTTVVATTINPGQQELPSASNWGIFGPGDCETFVARVFWVDPESKAQTEFPKPGGEGGPSTQFQVCP